jgi:hypothetical protein
MLPLLAVLLSIAASSSLAADYTLSSTSIANGSTNVGLNTTLKFTFTDPLYVIEDLEVVKESIIAIPSDDVEITGFRYADNNYSIEFDVVHEDDVTFYWVVVDVLFESGNSLAANSVLHYSTGSSISQKTISGQVEAYNIQFKGQKPEFVNPFSGSRKIQRNVASGTESTIQSDYNLEKSLVFVTNTLLEDVEEADLSTVLAVADVDSEGNYSIDGVTPGNYYIYGILIDGDDFAFGFYDADNNQEEDLVEYTTEMTDFDAPFIMRGYSGVFMDPFTADEFYAEVFELAKAELSDVKLMQIAGTETVETRTEEGKMYNSGSAYIWVYTFYSPSADSAIAVLTSPFYSFVYPVEKEMFGTPMSQIMELGVAEFRSQVAASQSYNAVGKQFIAIHPDDADITVTYELSRATSKYSDILGGTNTLYWDVYYEGTFFDFMGNGRYNDLLILLDAESGSVIHTSTPTSIENPSSEIPESVELSQNYPNPFNPTTQISFNLPQAMDIRLAIYDLLGREVAVLADGAFSAGSHSVNWNALDLSSGVYLYRLQAGAQTQMRKMTLMK